MPKSDIEIAREASMQPIAEVGARLGIPADAIMQYGPYKAKVSFDFLDGLRDRPDGKLILVKRVRPQGEGKIGATEFAANAGLAQGTRLGSGA